MSEQAGRYSVSRVALGMGAALSCGVVCAAALGALSGAAIVVALTGAALIAIVSSHDAAARATAHALVPLKVPSRVVVAAPTANELRVRSTRSDVA